MNKEDGFKNLQEAMTAFFRAPTEDGPDWPLPTKPKAIHAVEFTKTEHAIILVESDSLEKAIEKATEHFNDFEGKMAKTSTSINSLLNISKQEILYLVKNTINPGLTETRFIEMFPVIKEHYVLKV